MALFLKPNKWDVKGYSPIVVEEKKQSVFGISYTKI